MRGYYFLASPIRRGVTEGDGEVFMIGIIAEYDPFHNGHAWQLARARALGGGQPVAPRPAG